MNPLGEFGRPPVPPPSEGPKGALIGLAIVLAGVLGSMVFVSPAFHPTLFQYVVFVLVTSLILVIVWGLFGPAITRAVHNRKRNRKEQTATDLLSPDLKALVVDFFDFIDPRRGDYVPNCIEQWKSSAEFDKLPHVDLMYVRDAYQNVEDRLRNFDGSSEEFCRIVAEFEAALTLYDAVSIGLPLDALQQFPVEKLTNSHRERYRIAKRKYEAFMERHRTFTKKVNSAFGRNVSGMSFRNLKEL